MTDTPQTPAAVAYRLLQDIMKIERKSLMGQSAGLEKATAEWLLDTYGKCALQVRMANPILPKS